VRCMIASPISEGWPLLTAKACATKPRSCSTSDAGT
jgi:hypothetical protein